MWSGPSQHFNIGGDNGVERVDGVYASSGFFRMLGVQPILGTTLPREDDQHSGGRHVVISHRYWQERMGGIRKSWVKRFTSTRFAAVRFRLLE